MKIEIVTFLKVDYSEIEEIINEHYGFDDYSLASAEEVGNDVLLQWNIDGVVDEYDAEQIVARAESYYTRAYLNDLAQQGIIPKGEYLIDISW